MQQELKQLMSYAGTPKFDVELEKLYGKYGQDTRAKKQIADFIANGLKFSGNRIDEISIRLQLQEVADIISLSYIARHYFHKSKGWLSQRINQHEVNGKPATFTESEIQTFNRALKDISKKIGSFSIRY